jgi:hypothetical protein
MKSVIIFSIIVFVAALITNNWLVFNIEIPVSKTQPITKMNKFGIFNECIQKGDEYGCKKYPKQNKYPDVHKYLKMCQIFSVLGLMFLVASVICSFNGFSIKYRIDSSLQILGGIMLVCCVIVFSNKVEPNLRKATDSNITEGILSKVKTNYGYSFYLALVASILVLVDGVSTIIITNTSEYI